MDLTFTFDGIDYTLTYTRKTIMEMENKGFIASELQEKPMTVLPELFAGAFLAHHRHTRRDIIDKIYSKMTNKSELIRTLSDMYNEPILTLIEDPDENAEGNVTWTTSR